MTLTSLIFMEKPTVGAVVLAASMAAVSVAVAALLTVTQVLPGPWWILAPPFVLLFLVVFMAYRWPGSDDESRR